MSKELEKRCYGNTYEHKRALRKGITVIIIRENGFFRPKNCEYLVSENNRCPDMCCAGGYRRLGWCKHIKSY